MWLDPQAARHEGGSGKTCGDRGERASRSHTRKGRLLPRPFGEQPRRSRWPTEAQQLQPPRFPLFLPHCPCASHGGRVRRNLATWQHPRPQTPDSCAADMGRYTETEVGYGRPRVCSCVESAPRIRSSGGPTSGVSKRRERGRIARGFRRRACAARSAGSPAGAPAGDSGRRSFLRRARAWARARRSRGRASRPREGLRRPTRGGHAAHLSQTRG